MKIDNLKISNIKKSHKQHKILHGVSFNICSSKIYGLIGPNGAGKTTCFNIISGITKPNSGNIYFNEQEITNFNIYQRGKIGIRYLPQQSSVFTDMSVEQNIQAILEIYYKNASIRQDKLEQLLKDFNLTKLRNLKSTIISGGQKRRLEIARAMASAPEFLLLDEPFAGVDPIAADKIAAILKKLSKQGVGIFITDHNLKEIMSVMDYGYVMYEGKIFFAGTVKDITAHKDVKDIYLGEKFNL